MLRVPPTDGVAVEPADPVPATKSQAKVLPLAVSAVSVENCAVGLVLSLHDVRTDSTCSESQMKLLVIYGCFFPLQWLRWLSSRCMFSLMAFGEMVLLGEYLNS